MNNRRSLFALLGMLTLVFFLYYFGTPTTTNAQGSGGKLPECSGEKSGGGGGGGGSSLNLGKGANESCKPQSNEGYYEGKEYQWKCKQGEQEKTNILGKPCDVKDSKSGETQKGKCDQSSECKASNPEGKPPEMPKMPEMPKGGEEKPPQQPPKSDQASSTTPCLPRGSTSTASTAPGLLDRFTDIASTTPCLSDQSGTSTLDLSSWQWGSTTNPNASSTQGTTTATAFGLQMQNESNQGGSNGTNWTGVNGWDGWIRKASTVSIDESNIGTAGVPGSPDQARAYGSHAQFQQNVGFSQWSSIFNDYFDQLRASGTQGYSSASPRSPGSASGGSAYNSGTQGQGQGVATDGSQGAGQATSSRGANDDPRSEFYQYSASASFKENDPNAFPAPEPSMIRRAYTSFISTVRNALGL